MEEIVNAILRELRKIELFEKLADSTVFTNKRGIEWKYSNNEV